MTFYILIYESSHFLDFALIRPFIEVGDCLKTSFFIAKVRLVSGINTSRMAFNSTLEPSNQINLSWLLTPSKRRWRPRGWDWYKPKKCSFSVQHRLEFSVQEQRWWIVQDAVRGRSQGHHMCQGIQHSLSDPLLYLLSRTNSMVCSFSLWALGLCLCVLLPCIPYLMDSTKDVNHHCGHCGVQLATWYRSGNVQVFA